jgi:DNA-binding IclR family transcriptional regulator
MTQDRENGTRKTTETSLYVLDAIDDLGGGTLSELAEFTGMATSTLHTHLQTLIKTEHVAKIDGEYHLGMKIFYLGERARVRDKRYELARQTVSDLSERVAEEVTFCVEEYGRSIALFNKANRSHEDGSQVGQYFHMHSSASGKAMLAEYPEERVHEIADEYGLPQLTDSTITDIDELLVELERIRERGYAINREEEKGGLQAVAMSVHDPDGTVFGALCIIGPAYRISEPAEVADRIRPAAETLEQSLANRVRRPS